MKAKWYENLRTILKNSEKDADFLLPGNFWHVRGMRGKTQVTYRFQDGLGMKNPRSAVFLHYDWSSRNQSKTIIAIADLKRLVDERNLSLKEAAKFMLNYTESISFKS